MSQVWLYLDEDYTRKGLVFALRARGVDLLTALEADMINRNDTDHLATAAVSGKAFFSYNKGAYCALHQQWIGLERTHAGIIVTSQRQSSVGEELRRLMRLVSSLTADEMRNRLEFLSRWA